jgi:hypothetical protein
MKKRLELRDLRSLERRSMYSIFHPLDPDERLPRELIREGWRLRRLEVRYIELVAAFYVLAGALLVMGSLGIAAPVAFGVAGVMLLGFVVFAVSVWHRQSGRSKT